MSSRPSVPAGPVVPVVGLAPRDPDAPDADAPDADPVSVVSLHARGPAAPLPAPARRTGRAPVGSFACLRARLDAITVV
jgi:hypothetical protein